MLELQGEFWGRGGSIYWAFQVNNSYGLEFGPEKYPPVSTFDRAASELSLTIDFTGIPGVKGYFPFLFPYTFRICGNNSSETS